MTRAPSLADSLTAANAVGWAGSPGTPSNTASFSDSAGRGVQIVSTPSAPSGKIDGPLAPVCDKSGAMPCELLMNRPAASMLSKSRLRSMIPARTSDAAPISRSTQASISRVTL
jgi:hypothetical protein